MALSEVTRKQARSDVYQRIDQVGSTGLINDEINLWLDRGQYDFFNRMSSLVEKWYGTNETLSSISPSNGAITQIALAGNYAASKIAKIVKFMHADGTTIWHPVEFGKLEYMLANSTYDTHYAYAWFGENLHIFVGTSATAPSGDSGTLYFIRKPDEMGGDTNVWTITVNNYADKTDGDQIIIDGIVLEQRAATTEKATFVAETSHNATAQNIDDVIGNVFGSTSGVTVSVNSAVVTVTGAKTVSVSQTTSTFLTLAASTASMLDVPTEYVDLPILFAQARALGKLQRQDLRRGIEQDIANQYANIHATFAEEIQIKAGEKAAGIQTRRLE